MIVYLFRLQIRNTKVEQASKPKRAPASEASIISTMLFALFFGGSSNGVPRTTPKTMEVGACAVDVTFSLDVTVVWTVAFIAVSVVVLVVSAVVSATEVAGNRVLFSNDGFEVGLMSVTAKTIKQAEIKTPRNFNFLHECSQSNEHFIRFSRRNFTKGEGCDNLVLSVRRVY